MLLCMYISKLVKNYLMKPILRYVAMDSRTRQHCSYHKNLAPMKHFINLKVSHVHGMAFRYSKPTLPFLQQHRQVTLTKLFYLNYTDLSKAILVIDLAVGLLRHCNSYSDNWWIGKDEQGGDFGKVHSLSRSSPCIEEIREYIGRYSWWLNQDSEAIYEEHTIRLLYGCTSRLDRNCSMQNDKRNVACFLLNIA
jgi:hypothetical protein